jgi:hypothetical protein
VSRGPPTLGLHQMVNQAEQQIASCDNSRRITTHDAVLVLVRSILQVRKGGPQFSYGIKENLEISISAPFHVEHGEHPTGRFTAMMPGDPQVAVLLAWRFYHASTGIGSRNEATFYAGASALTQRVPRADGPPLGRQPGLYGVLAAGHVSQRYDVWVGAGYQHYARWTSSVDDHQSDSLLSSFVVGWRPPFLNKDYPKPDLRFFWEHSREGRLSSARCGPAWKFRRARPRCASASP